MCELCVKHGEGKKWYINAKNYNNDLLSDIKRKKIIKNFFHWADETYNKYFNLLKRLPFDKPLIGVSLKTIIRMLFINNHWGQVVPIEDVERIISMTNSITRIPCVCRKITKGKEVRTCFLISFDVKNAGMAEIIDQSFFGGPDVAKFEKVDNTNAINFMRNQERNGLFHSIWTFKTPFIGAICNCDRSGCIALKMYQEAAPIFFKAEYIVKIDKDMCAGCRECITVCPFGALKYDTINKKAVADREKCHGCGICRSACKENALRLTDSAKGVSPQNYG